MSGCVNRLGCASSAGRQEAELGTTLEETCPTSAETNREAVVRNHGKNFFKKREIGSGKRRLRVAKAGKEKPVLGTTGR